MPLALGVWDLNLSRLILRGLLVVGFVLVTPVSPYTVLQCLACTRVEGYEYGKTRSVKRILEHILGQNDPSRIRRVSGFFGAYS